MKRVRWLGAQWPVPMRGLAVKMKSQLFTPESLDGFVIERVREDSIEARYIEKLSYQETITDPFGKEEVFDRVAYRNVEFTLFSEFPHIELRDAHRSTREFLNKLLELCNFSVAIEPITIDLLDWVDAFEKYISQKITIDSLQASGLELEAGVSAKVLLKGNKDVREALKHLSAKRKFVLEKVQVKIPVGQQVISIHMSSSGTAKIPEDHLNDFLDILRTSLAAQKIMKGPLEAAIEL